VYLWIHPQSRQQFLRIVYVATLVGEDPALDLDGGIFAVHWYTLEDLKRRGTSLRSPIVIRCLEDYATGRRRPQSLLPSMLPIHQNIDLVLANASLV
jgi:hypothetical protein